MKAPEISYEVTIEFEETYIGTMPTVNDIEDSLRKGLPDEFSGDITSIYAEEIK